MIAVLFAAALVQAAPEAPEPAQIEAARRALDLSLFDYPSARFRDVRGNRFILCGLVNSKNRMGAYTGWSKFAVIVRSEARVYVAGESGSGDIMLELCDVPDSLAPADLSERLSSR